jgi:tetratricopeptide (TPR) repeat protein
MTANRNGAWRDDLALFSSALRVDPSSADASYNLALALAARGDVEGAARQWERTVFLDPRHVGALSQLGTWHAERGRLDDAAAYFARVLEVDPRDVETRFNMGLLLEKAHRPREALAQYEAFLALNPVDYPELVPRVEERARALRTSLAPDPR